MAMSALSNSQAGLRDKGASRLGCRRVSGASSNLVAASLVSNRYASPAALTRCPFAPDSPSSAAIHFAPASGQRWA
jgi:hypothetical protein